MARKRKEVDAEDVGVTRCVCGEEELYPAAAKQRGVDSGLFIQCEQCGCWQHGFCVGFNNSRDAPEVYFCEKCKPEMHEIITKNGYPFSKYAGTRRNRRRSRSESDDDSSEPSGSTREKRRRTMNSREDEMLQRAIEESKREARERERRQSDIKDEDLKLEENDNTPEQARNSDPGDEHPEGDAPEEPAERAPSDHDKEPAPEPEPEPEQHEPEPEHEEEKQEPEPEEQPERKRKKRGRGRQKSSHVNGEPRRAKPKMPSARSTMADMRKRIAQILEFSGYTQVEMLAEERNRAQMLEEQKKHDNARLIQQMEDLCTQQRDNITFLEDLTRKVLAWQERFG